MWVNTFQQKKKSCLPLESRVSRLQGVRRDKLRAAPTSDLFLVVNDLQITSTSHPIHLKARRQRVDWPRESFVLMEL